MTVTIESALHVLTPDECWRLLGQTVLGRLGAIEGEGVDIFPINFLVKQQVIYFRSAPGSKLAAITASPLVAIEADGIVSRFRWSVVVKGHATRVNSDAEIEDSGVLGLHSLVPTEKWNYVRVDPVTVTGRRFLSARRPA
jgi:hypothetical protein